MKLSVPTNWQPDLLGRINKSKVAEIYGKLERDPVGGGRPSFMLPYISKTQAKEYISTVHKAGLKFNYLLNASCLGNIEWTAQGQKRIRKFLDWLTAIGVDAVTVAVPYLLQVVKKCYPHFATKISVCAGIYNPIQAKYWESLGADEVSLSPWLVNRNFKLLRRIRAAVNCDLQIYANTRCLIGCPFANYHYSSTSHSSTSSGINNGFFINYCMYSCAYLALSEPWRLIASCWIRPEDLHYYKEAGINTVKLSERGIKTEYIQRIVEAYTEEEYDGNLMDLFLSPSKSLTPFKKYSWKKIKFFFHPFGVDLFKLHRFLTRIPADDPTHLDNKKLDGFLKFFVEKKCRQGNCDECGYCRDVAKKALYIPEGYRNKMLGIYKDLLEEIIDGGVFKINSNKMPG